MKETSVKVNENEERKYYLSEFSFDDGDTFPLLRDNDGKLYFEFGRFYENKIKLDNFTKVGD